MRKIKIITIVLSILLMYNSSVLFADKLAPNFSGQDYLDLSHDQRADAISSFIKASELRGVTIQKNDTFYRDKLDIFYAEHPDFIEEALFVVLKTLIIMEYDWDKKGLDKELLARKWLGEDLYQVNKFRLGVGRDAGSPAR